jgi:SAM-dependent methyltransferase
MTDEGFSGEINTRVAHPARIYDYYLGGKDNFRVDRETAELALAATPSVRDMARQNRAFLQRVVRYLAGEAGIRQFLDIGTGLPTQGNVHEIAQAVAPEARVVYVDNDPIVHVHANALLAGDSTTVVLADLRDTEALLAHPAVQQVIDFDRPVAILLVAILHFIGENDDPMGILKRLRDAVVPGSYLVISHGTGDFDERAASGIAKAYSRSSAPGTARSHAEVLRLFDGFDLVEPGLVQVSLWRPEVAEPRTDGIWIYGGVGRKRP